MDSPVSVATYLIEYREPRMYKCALDHRPVNNILSSLGFAARDAYSGVGIEEALNVFALNPNILEAAQGGCRSFRAAKFPCTIPILDGR